MLGVVRTVVRAVREGARARVHAALERVGAREMDVDAVTREVFRGPMMSWPRPRRGEGWARREATVEEMCEGEARARRAGEAFAREWERRKEGGGGAERRGASTRRTSE